MQPRVLEYKSAVTSQKGMRSRARSSEFSPCHTVPFGVSPLLSGPLSQIPTSPPVIRINARAVTDCLFPGPIFGHMACSACRSKVKAGLNSVSVTHLGSPCFPNVFPALENPFASLRLHILNLGSENMRFFRCSQRRCNGVRACSPLLM